MLVIIGASVLALVLVLVVGAGVLLNRVRSAAEPSDPAGAGGSGGASAPSTTYASDAVRAYLEALAAGKADAALALSDSQAADTTFLTDAVLQDSLSRAPITAINVPDVTDESAYTVDASYKMGTQAVSQSYSVKKAGTGWKVRDGFAELTLTSTRNKTLPLVINKLPVKTDRIRVFPGSYVFTTGNTFVDYGKENVLLLEAPTDYPSMAAIQPTLTAAGAQAFEDAATAALKKCAVDGDLSPAGCPNAVRQSSYQKIDEDSVTWKLDDNPMANIKPRLDFQNPVVVTASGSVSFNFSAKGTQFDRPATFGPQDVRAFATIRADLSRNPLKVTFTR